LLGKKLKPRTKSKLIFKIVFSMVFFALIFFTLNYYENYTNSKNKPKPVKKSIGTITEENAGKVEQFELIIDKIDVSVHVTPNVLGTDNQIYTEALKNGVAHYKGTALPASGSNILIFGHSSAVKGSGAYAKIFSRLKELVSGDEIEIKFNNKNYQYLVTDIKIVSKTDISPIKPTEREQLTLMTCWPIGTDKKRLIVIAIPNP